MATTPYMADQEIVLGTRTEIKAQFYNDAGGAWDMTVSAPAQRRGLLRMRLRDSTGAPAYTRTTTSGTHWGWYTQAQGFGYWIFGDAETFTEGTYDVDVLRVDENSVEVLVGRAVYVVKYPPAGPVT